MLEVMDRAEFDAVFRMMEEAFPPDERRPAAEQRALLDEPGFCLYVLRRGGRVAGFMAVRDFVQECGCTYLEHFAVAPELRGQGLGAAMLRELAARSAGMLVAEVEPPDTETARRRIAFYCSQGFCLNAHDYVQPPISAGRNPVPLRIVSAPQALDDAGFMRLRNTLYRRVYRCGGQGVSPA